MYRLSMGEHIPSLRVLVLLVALCGMITLVAGCANRQRQAQQDAGTIQIEPLEPRIDVIHGRMLMMPVEITGGTPPDTIPLALDDRRTIQGDLYWITVASDPAPARWILPAGRWSAIPAREAVSAESDRRSQSGRGRTGGWVLAVDLPHDAFNQGLWIGSAVNQERRGGRGRAGQRVPLNWYLAPSVMPIGREAWSSPHPQADAATLALASPELQSPQRRWRYRLLADALHSTEPSPFEDPIIDALAMQHESRWLVALGLLHLADPAVQVRVRQRLAAIAEFPEMAAPAWPTDQGDLDRLLADLLNPNLDASGRAMRASAWLDAQPPAAIWVIDDAGLRDAGTGATVSTVGAANLSGREVVGSAAQAGAYLSPDLRTIPANSARTLAPIALPPPAPSPTSGPAMPQVPEVRPVAPQPISFTVGRWSGVRAAVTDALPIMPPGFRLEPMLADWTLPAWLAGAPDLTMRTPAGWTTSALLYYEPAMEAGGGGNGASGRSGAQGTWMVHLECRGPAEVEGTEEVRLWLGPFGSPAAVLRVGRDGSIHDELSGSLASSAHRRDVRTHQLTDRWVARIPIDPRHIGADGELLLGISRTDARGLRTAWPRPMLPWQHEPGRLRLATTMWGEIAPPPEVER